jgi:hypothetical protein
MREVTGSSQYPHSIVEVKKTSSYTLNQVRAVKYMPLVVYSSTEERWYVIPASEVVRQCAQERRGQHTENPFESATLSMRNLSAYALADASALPAAVLSAVEEAQKYPALKELLDRVLADSTALAARSVEEVGAALREAGLA